MIRAESLRKIFYPPRAEPVIAVHGATFEVADGEVFGLLGPNGAGKTTLLRMLATILTPSSGRCVIGGVPPDADPVAFRRHIGFLSGNTRLYGRLTARETLHYFGRLYRMPRGAIAGRTRALSELLGMEAFLDRRCDSLSTGQLQRVSIARCIVHDPAVLILDEPTLGLDIMSSRTILRFIAGERARGRSIVFSTHYMTEAEMLCDRIALIHRGALLAVGTPAALCEHTDAGNLQEAFLSLVGEKAPAP